MHSRSSFTFYWTLIPGMALLLLGSCHQEIPESLPLPAATAVPTTIDADLLQSADSVMAWLEAIQLPNGLVETSYNSNLVSLYDNALAALAFTQAGQFDRAQHLLAYFNGRLQTEMLVGTGGYFQFRTAMGQPQGNRWLGDNAWLLLAIENYKHYTNSTQFDAMQNAIATWITTLQDADGGLWGGTDANGNTIGKNTEGMIDAFIASPGYTPFHANLLHYLEAERWDTTDHFLVSWPDNFYYYALDNFSWGYCAFEGFPEHVLDGAQRFVNTQWHAHSNRFITGYCFDDDLDAVWLEGSGQMAVALSKAQRYQEANAVLHEIQKALTPQPPFVGVLGLPYASNVSTHYGNSLLWPGSDVDPTTASSTWFVMACALFDPFAINYHKSIPTAHRFW